MILFVCLSSGDKFLGFLSQPRYSRGWRIFHPCARRVLSSHSPTSSLLDIFAYARSVISRSVPSWPFILFLVPFLFQSSCPPSWSSFVISEPCVYTSLSLNFMFTHTPQPFTSTPTPTTALTALISITPLPPIHSHSKPSRNHHPSAVSM